MSHTQYNLQSWTNFLHKESHNILAPWASLEELSRAEQKLEKFYKEFCKPKQHKTTAPTKQYSIFKSLINITKHHVEKELFAPKDVQDQLFLDFLSDNNKKLRKESIGILFVDEEKENRGVTGRLDVTLVGKKGQLIFSCPENNRFLITNNTFLEAIDRVKQLALASKLWDAKHSVCWSIHRNDNKPIDCVNGASLGGAFAIVIMKLLKQNQPYSLNKVICSATCDEKGNFGTVNHINDKIKSVNDNYYSTMIISPQETIHLDERYTKNLHIIRAKDIDEATKEIINNQDSRRHLLEKIKADYETIKLFDGVELPMGKNYQNIPILQEIKPHRLPKHDLESQASNSEWERLQKEKNTQNNKLDINKDILFSKDFAKPRLVVTGAPGSGKSTMIRNIVWTLAQKALENNCNTVYKLNFS